MLIHLLARWTYDPFLDVIPFILSLGRTHIPIFKPILWASPQVYLWRGYAANWGCGCLVCWLKEGMVVLWIWSVPLILGRVVYLCIRLWVDNLWSYAFHSRIFFYLPKTRRKKREKKKNYVEKLEERIKTKRQKNELVIGVGYLNSLCSLLSTSFPT